MARMFPSPIGPTKSGAERRLYHIFAEQLDDEFVVFHDVAWLTKGCDQDAKDGQADFVIAHPALGVCVVEVKGGSISRHGPTNTWTSVSENGVPHQIKDPFEQARREMYDLREIAEAMPEWPAQRVRFFRAVAFPDAAYAVSQTPAAKAEIVIDADDLVTVASRLREISGWWLAHPEAGTAGANLSRAGIEALTALLARTVTIPSPLRVGADRDDERLIELTGQQFALLDFLRHQRRALITGFAGAGKTMLAAEHGRRLARQGMSVLVTCVDRPLADHLRASVGQLDRVEVTTFDELKSRLLHAAGVDVVRSDENSAWARTVLPGLLMQAIQLLPDRYDAMIVDEAQDILSVWWEPLRALLRGEHDEIIYVFGDDNQDLYHLNDPLESGIVMTFDLPRYELTQNRRTTEAIHRFALQFYTPPAGSPEPDALGPPGRQISVRDYPDVGETEGIDQHSESAKECRRQLSRELHEIINVGKVRSSDVMILTPRTRASWLIGVGAQRFVGSFELIPEMLPDGSTAPPPEKQTQVRVAHLNRFKGLEAKVVILAEIDGRIPDDELAATLYVGSTRARVHLAVIGDEKHAAVARLAAGDASPLAIDDVLLPA